MTLKAQKTGRKSIILRLAILVFAVYMIVSLSSLWVQLVSSRKELNRLNLQAQEKALKISELSRLLEDGTEAELIERAARDRLGYVYADEQVYIDISGS